MVKLKCYSPTFEEEYFNSVSEALNKCGLDKNQLIESCKVYLPPDFFKDGEDDLKTLILSSFSELKRAYKSMTIEATKDTMLKNCFDIIHDEKNEKDEYKAKPIYRKYMDLYPTLRDKQKDKKKMSVRMVEDLGVNVCPYCNRDYINCRGGKISGAQLDHFYPKDDFPFFAVSLYNLVPVCGNCNRVKSKQQGGLASPFDDLDFDGSLQISYTPIDEHSVKVIMTAKNGLQHNIQKMHIQEAYAINNIDIEELIYKSKAYSSAGIKELLSQYEELGLSETEIKKIVFGEKIEPSEFGIRPLSKLKSDILKELKIW